MVKPYDSASKRKVLLRAATDLFYRHGYRATSLADIANEAGIPLGNLHYYFSSKRALAEAVITAHRAGMVEAFEQWEAVHADPLLRLRALVNSPNQATEHVVRWGCPQGSLSQELEKGEPDQLAAIEAPMLKDWVDWAERQFRLMGRAEDARARALQLVAGIQGTMLLALALHSAEVLREGLARIESDLVSQSDVPTSRS